MSDDTYLTYIEADAKFGLEDFINKKSFTVADTPLSYRQTNSLSRDNLLPESRERKEGWRKFSFKELIYILVVNELKKFGLKHTQLVQLKESFFGEPVIKNGVTENRTNKTNATQAIGCVFGQVEMNITIDSEGLVVYYDPLCYVNSDISSLGAKISSSPYILISLNDIVNRFLTKIGKKPFPVTFSVAAISHKNDISIKESELIKILRNGDYKAIRVRKKNGEISNIYAEKEKEVKDDGDNIFKIIEANDFFDINIVKRDGKIVSYKMEESFKI